MRAVIYARYSTDLQRDASIEDQVRALPRAASTRRAGTLVATYTDHAISGASRLRPGYQKLLEDARAGRLRRRGGRGARPAVARPGGHRRPLQAAALRRGAAGDAGRGRDQRAACRPQGHDERAVPQGSGRQDPSRPGGPGAAGPLRRRPLLRLRRRPRASTPRGEPIHGGRRINEAEADGRAAHLRASSPPAARRAPSPATLNAEGVPGPRRPAVGRHRPSAATARAAPASCTTSSMSAGWSGTGSATSRTRRPAGGWRGSIPAVGLDHPRGAGAAHRRRGALGAGAGAPGLDPRSRRASPRRGPAEFWKQRRPQHLLTGLARCGACGGPLAAVGSDYLACGRRPSARAPARTGGASAARCWRTSSSTRSRTRLMAPELVKEFIAELPRARSTGSAPCGRARRRLQRPRAGGGQPQARRARRGDRRRPARAGAAGRRSTSWSSARRRSTAELAAAPAPAPRLHPNLAELYRRKVADLQTALADPATRTEALEILRGLIERVVAARRRRRLRDRAGRRDRRHGGDLGARNGKAAPGEVGCSEVYPRVR